MSIATAVGGVVVLVGGYLVVRRMAATAERSTRRPVLPSHYEGVLYATGGPQSVPGRCENCDTENEPGYVFCRSCGERL